jgi:predicted transcriptional regulator
MKRQETRKDFVNLILRIPQTSFTQIKLIAEKEDKSRSLLIVEAVEQFLKRKN